jgi:hypothetical protein
MSTPCYGQLEAEAAASGYASPEAAAARRRARADQAAEHLADEYTEHLAPPTFPAKENAAPARAAQSTEQH